MDIKRKKPAEIIFAQLLIALHVLFWPAILIIDFDNSFILFFWYFVVEIVASIISVIWLGIKKPKNFRSYAVIISLLLLALIIVAIVVANALSNDLT